MDHESLQKKLLRCTSIAEFLDFWIKNASILSEENLSYFKKYYRNYFANFGPRMHRNYKAQYIEIEEEILQRKLPSLLDIGSGCGTEALWFAKLGADVTGIEVAEIAAHTALERQKIVERLEGKPLRCQFKINSVFNFEPTKNAFDIIWMNQAFHHIEPRQNFFRLLPQLLKKDGALVITESNAWNPVIQISLLKFRGLKTIVKYERNDGIFYYGNERIILPCLLKKNLEKSGLKIKSTRFFRLLPSKQIFDKFEWLETIWPNFLFPAFTHYTVVATKV